MEFMVRTRFAPRLLALVAIASAGAGTALAVGGPIIKSHNSRLGAIVVNASGLTLYHLTSEKNGAIKCVGACTALWPPVMISGKGKPALGPGLLISKLGTVRRPNGKLQLTYNKFPLYRNYLDKEAGETSGEAVKDGAGTWYAISTKGNIVKSGGQAAPPGTTNGTTPTTTSGTTTSSGYGY
jgi:predicted lipoprotein with Yx(FWY)xxD motif